MFGWLIDVPVVHCTRTTTWEPNEPAQKLWIKNGQNGTSCFERPFLYWCALIKTSPTGGSWLFELQIFSFWKIWKPKHPNWIKTQTKCTAWENWNPLFSYFKNQPQYANQANMKRCCIWAKKKKKKMFDSLFYSVFAPSPQFQNYILLWLLKQDWWENVKYWTCV